MAVQRRLSNTFKSLFESEKAGGIILIVCTVISIVIANSFIGPSYKQLWSSYIGPLSFEHWINDGLMAIFFLMVGLELKRELISGELSNLRHAMLPVIAAIGGVAVPAGIHLAFNIGTPYQPGIGIPMATDIAFALGVLALLGDRVPASLKIFLTALAVIDDLVAILVIAIFYTSNFSAIYLLGAFVILGGLFFINRFLGVKHLAIYLLLGAVMWFLMLKSGVHATIAGVLLAFAIPSSDVDDDHSSPSHRLEHFLHRPVAFTILPLFALANTGIVLSTDVIQMLYSTNSLGIILGLVIGKPIGILALSFAAVKAKICSLPLDLNWNHVLGAGLLGGIGFTMSIFITNLAFTVNSAAINSSTFSVLIASLTAGIVGFVWLKLFGRMTDQDVDSDSLDFAEEE